MVTRNRAWISRSVVLLLAAGTAVRAQTAAQTATGHAATKAPSHREPRPDMTPVVLPGGRIDRDVAYVPNGHKQQKLDVYAPVGAKSAPVVIFVHGGEWTKGDKSEVSSKPKFFNENGIVFVSVNYRLSGTSHHPAQVNDVAAAVRWVRDHITGYGGDPTKLVLMGHSAGCHIVTLIGLDPRPLGKVGLKPSDLRAVVSWSGGAFDLVEKVHAGGMYAGYIRLNFGEKEAGWRDASPMEHIDDFKPMPRFLFANAENGYAHAKAASKKMVSLIRDAGGHAQGVLLKDRTHLAAIHKVGMPGDVTGPMLLRFIREVTESTATGGSRGS